MKFLLLIPIRLYWHIMPEHRRRPCLFKETCSNHVHRVTKSEGLIEGMRAFRDRFRMCRPGYHLYRTDTNDFQLELCNGVVIHESAISEHVLPHYSYSFQELDQDSYADTRVVHVKTC